MADIEIGTQVHVKVVKSPTNVAAVKTIRRLLAKDPIHAAEVRRQTDVRATHMRHEQRGGRQWAVRRPKQHATDAAIGDQGTVLATADVIRDLGSVARFVEVSPA